MHIQTVTSRVFNHDPSAVKRAAKMSPVQITDRGRVSHVLLSIEKYEEITNAAQNISELLGMYEVSDIDLDIKPLTPNFAPVEFD